MNVFIEENHAIPLVRVSAATTGGCVYDPPGKEGLAQVTARMLRRGTAGMTGDQIESGIDALGASLSIGANSHFAQLHLTVIRRSLDPAVELAGKLLSHPVFDETVLARFLREVEAEVVQERDDDSFLADRELDRALFGAHPYGAQTTLASVRAITPADVRDFFNRHYHQLEAVSVSGAVVSDEAMAQAGKLAVVTNRAALERRQAVVFDGTDPAAPTLRPGRHLVFVDKPDRTQNQILVGTLGTDAHDPDHFALLVANTAFGGTFNARLMEEVRSKRGWSYGAYSGISADRQRGPFILSVAPKAADAPACLALVLDMLHQLREDGLTADEVERMKRYLVRSHAFSLETAEDRVRHRLNTCLYRRPEGYDTAFVQRIEAVTVEEANAAVRRRLSDRDLVISVVGTHASQGEGIVKAVAGLESVVVVPFDRD